jgi:hypothetical protein
MNRWERLKAAFKENPYKVGFRVMTGICVLYAINGFILVKIANKQAETIEEADKMLGWIAEAIEKGWDLALEGNVIDIIPTENSQPLQAV